MPGLDNQSTSTFLLLIVLGCLIYYLCTPCENFEDFENTPKKLPVPTQRGTAPTLANNVPASMVASMAHYVNPSAAPSMAPRAPVLSEDTPSMAPKAPVLSEAAPSMATKAPVAPTQAATMAPVQSRKQQEEPTNYDPSSGSGADLEYAFESDMNLRPNVNAVELNKKENINYDSADFLPKETNAAWFDTDFAEPKYKLNDDNLINTERYVIGINTVGQSLKNGSHDLRGTIPNPKFTISPWNNSTYEPDMNIRPLC